MPCPPSAARKQSIPARLPTLSSDAYARAKEHRSRSNGGSPQSSFQYCGPPASRDLASLVPVGGYLRKAGAPRRYCAPGYRYPPNMITTMSHLFRTSALYG